MAELKLEISDGINKMLGNELKKAETKLLLESAVEDRLKLLVLFKIVDKILSKSKLSEDKFSGLVNEFRGRLAKRYGV